jgi:hypothetical protein
MSTSLRLRCMIARSKHRGACISVETETQFGPATPRLEQLAKTTSRRTWSVGAGDLSDGEQQVVEAGHWQ